MQGENERQWKKSERKKRVTKNFLEVSRCSRARQRQRNVQKKVCCTCKVAFLLIRPIVVFHRSLALPSPLSVRELKMETFSGGRQLQPNVTPWFVQNCACSYWPHCRRAPVGDVKLVCLALWREREYLTLISIRFAAFSNQNFADYRP